MTERHDNVIAERRMQAQGTVDVFDEHGVLLGTATFNGGRMEWSWRLTSVGFRRMGISSGRPARGWRKTGKAAVAAIEKATKSREEQRG